MKIAITGASGFIGNRIVEKFYLENIHEVVPLARSNSSLVLPARFDLPWGVCDHFNADDLSKAFDGCEAVVHTAIAGPFAKMAKAVYLAADKVGARRLVVLSSASIYNQNPIPGVTEDSPLPERSATGYNAGKIAADKMVRRLRSKGKTEIVFLMPSIVFGPRSSWIAKLANQITDGTASLIGGGNGICNTVYVDNLVEAVRLSLSAAGVDGESFFVSDSETVTWGDFYRPVASALGATFEDLHFIEDPPVFTTSVGERVRTQILSAAQAESVQTIKPFVPAGLKKLYKSAMSFSSSNHGGMPDPLEFLREKQPEVTLEMSLLQQCVYKLPNAKAERLLDYHPTVPFAEGMNRSVSWLKFAGYPVVT